MKSKTIEPIDVSIEELGQYRNALKTYTITHEFKRKGSDSMMTEWLWTLPDSHKIVIGKQAGKLIGWACGDACDWKDTLGYSEKIYGKSTYVVGIYILKDHRKRGYGFQLGKQLFTLAKEQTFKRIYMQFRTKSAGKMYSHLAEFIGAKRKPFTPPSMSHDKSWKLVKL